MKYFKKIVGERLYLSPMCMDDVLQYCTWLNDIEVARGLHQYTNAVNLINEKEYIEKNSNSPYDFAIVNKENDELIGNCSLMNVNLINGTAELGIFIGDAKDRGKGYGAEAIKLLLNYGFNYCNLENIMLTVYSFNSCAIKCYEKAGFKKIGVRSKAYYFNNERYDQIYMEILKEDFNKGN